MSLSRERVDFFLAREREKVMRVLLRELSFFFFWREMSFLLREIFFWERVFLSIYLERVGVTSFAWDGRVFLLGEFVFRERVEIVPFLETVEFLSYGGCFFLSFVMRVEFFVFDKERELRSLCSWDRFFSLEGWVVSPLRGFGFFEVRNFEVFCFLRERAEVSLWESCVLFFHERVQFLFGVAHDWRKVSRRVMQVKRNYWKHLAKASMIAMSQPKKKQSKWNHAVKCSLEQKETHCRNLEENARRAACQQQ